MMTSNGLGERAAVTEEPIALMVPVLGEEEIAAVSDVLRSGWVAQGPRVAEFEKRFAATVGAAHGIAVSSCTAGLHLAMVLAGVGPGDEVIVPSFSFIASTNAPVYAGATPVYADVDPVTGNVTASTIEAALTERTRAVMVVHQAGVPAELSSIETLCRQRGIVLVEDAACAIGSTYEGAPIGSRGHVAVFSFHPRKLLTTGEGGMIVLDDEALAQRGRRLREHGMSMSAAERHLQAGTKIESYTEIGFNYRMTDIQAAIGLVQLDRLAPLISRRRALAARYQEQLGSSPHLRCVGDPRYGTTNFQSFWVEVGPESPLDRQGLMDLLARHGVATRRGIMAAHLEPAGAGWARGPLPATEHLTSSSLILPLHDQMTASDIDRVCKLVLDAIS